MATGTANREDEMSAESKPTEGPWRPGKNGSCVVADHPVPEIGGSDEVDYYGGHLIAESIAPQNVPIIAAAPELLAALEGAIGALEFSLDYHRDLGNSEIAFAADKLDAALKAIAKAKGAAQ